VPALAISTGEEWRRPRSICVCSVILTTHHPGRGWSGEILLFFFFSTSWPCSDIHALAASMAASAGTIFGPPRVLLLKRRADCCPKLGLGQKSDDTFAAEYITAIRPKSKNPKKKFSRTSSRSPKTRSWQMPAVRPGSFGGSSRSLQSICYARSHPAQEIGHTIPWAISNPILEKTKGLFAD